MSKQNLEVRATCQVAMRVPWDPLADLIEFHRKFGLEMRSTPGFPAIGRQLLRAKLLREEMDEMVQEHAEGDIAAFAKELADMLYILFGTAIEYGIDMRKVFAAVHASNMSKDGDIRADGKLLKGPSYQAPDVAKVLAEQGPLL